jgi:hypothetical protein
MFSDRRTRAGAWLMVSGLTHAVLRARAFQGHAASLGAVCRAVDQRSNGAIELARGDALVLYIELKFARHRAGFSRGGELCDVQISTLP